MKIERHLDHAVFPARPQTHQADMVGRAPLQQDRLPDAAERPVPALLAGQDLAERVLGIGGRIVGRRGDVDRDLVDAGAENGADLRLERQPAALVLGHGRAVHEHPRVVVDGAEAEEDGAAQPLGRNSNVRRYQALPLRWRRSGTAPARAPARCTAASGRCPRARSSRIAAEVKVPGAIERTACRSTADLHLSLIDEADFAPAIHTLWTRVRTIRDCQSRPCVRL